MFVGFVWWARVGGVHVCVGGGVVAGHGPCIGCAWVCVGAGVVCEWVSSGWRWAVVLWVRGVVCSGVVGVCVFWCGRGCVLLCVLMCVFCCVLCCVCVCVGVWVVWVLWVSSGWRVRVRVGCVGGRWVSREGVGRGCGGVGVGAWGRGCGCGECVLRVCACVPRVCVCVFCVCVCVFRACVGLRVCGWGVWRAACVGRGKVEQVCVCSECVFSVGLGGGRGRGCVGGGAWAGGAGGEAGGWGGWGGGGCERRLGGPHWVLWRESAGGCGWGCCRGTGGAACSGCGWVCSCSVRGRKVPVGRGVAHPVLTIL